MSLLGKGIEARRGRRVVASHAIARASFLAAGVFAAVAVGWAVWVVWRGDSWWGPLHTFLAGTVLLAIAGATQMFTITWSAAPAPPAVLARTQRWTLVAGVALVLVGMASDVGWVIVTGAVLAIVGLGLLALSLWSAVRNSLLRRFDLSARFYMLAIAAGVIGISLGGIMGAEAAGQSFLDIRLVHSHLNLVGLVGFTIVGTLPTILPTFAHHKAVSGIEAKVSWWLAVLAAVLIGSGLFVGGTGVGIGTALAGVALFLILAGVLVRLGKRGFEGGLPYLQVTVGSVWLGTWAIVEGIRITSGWTPEHFSEWTAAVVIAGVGQVLLGSLAYLLPVLAGPAPRLGRNFARTHSRPWLPLGLANVGAVALLAGFPVVAFAAVAAWVVDFGVRLAIMEWGSGNKGGGEQNDHDRDETAGDSDGPGSPD